MSQVVGLFAIVDLGTEYLRFLGSTSVNFVSESSPVLTFDTSSRFLVGYVIEGDDVG